VERFLSRQGHSGPTKVRLVVTDALGHGHGRYFEVLARSEEGPMSKMRRLLVDKLEDRLSETTPRGVVHVDRREIEGWGAEIGLNPDETARLFEDLEGIAWRGEYVRSLEGGWTGARMRYVR
jgi:hypothetical protein